MGRHARLTTRMDSGSGDPWVSATFCQTDSLEENDAETPDSPRRR